MLYKSVTNRVNIDDPPNPQTADTALRRAMVQKGHSRVMQDDVWKIAQIRCEGRES